MQVGTRSLFNAIEAGQGVGGAVVSLDRASGIPVEVLVQEAGERGFLAEDGRFLLSRYDAARIAILATANALVQPNDPGSPDIGSILRRVDAQQVIHAIDNRITRKEFRHVCSTVLRETVSVPELYAGVETMVKESGGPIRQWGIREATDLRLAPLSDSPLVRYSINQVEQRRTAGEVIDMEWLTNPPRHHIPGPKEWIRIYSLAAAERAPEVLDAVIQLSAKAVKGGVVLAGRTLKLIILGILRPGR